MVEARMSCWQCRRLDCVIRCSQCNYAPYCSEYCMLKDLYRHKQLECFHFFAQTTCALCHKTHCVPTVACSKCFSLVYCSSACLNAHAPTHTNECLASRQAIIMNARKLEKASENKLPSVISYIGHTPAIDYLKLHQNEGNESRNLHLLLVCMSDIRSVVKTVVELPVDFGGHVTFHLHENRIHLMARNILFFYLAITNPLPQYMTQMWYSTWYSEKCHRYVTFGLTQLTASGSYEKIVQSMRDVVSVTRESWLECVPVWQAWLQFGHNDPATAIAAIDQQRARRLGSWALSPSMHQRGCSMPVCHQFSWRLWFEDGLLLPPRSPDRAVATRANCTLLCFNPCKKNSPLLAELRSSDVSLQLAEVVNREADLVYGVPSNDSVFAAWDFLQVKSIAGERRDLLDMYLQYINAMFYTFCKCISRRTVNFRLFSGPPDAIAPTLLRDDKMKMDRICIVDAEETFSTPQALRDMRALLNTSNSHSLMITHHERWYSLNELDRCGNAHAREPALLLALKDVELRPYVLEGIEGRKSDAVRQYWSCTDDYLDAWPLVYKYLQAEILNFTSSVGSEDSSCKMRKTLVVEEFARQMGFHLRCFFKDHHSVVPFRLQSNIRRVSMQKSSVVSLEWKPIPILSMVDESK